VDLLTGKQHGKKMVLLWQQNKGQQVFVAATKNFAAAAKRFVDRT